MNNLTRTLVLSCILAASGAAQRASDAERDLEAAVNKEVVQGELNTAIGLYRNILARYGSQRAIAAQALFHLGQCHEKLGRAEARKHYEHIVNEYADQKDLTAQARSRLTSLSGEPSQGGDGIRVRRILANGCGFNNNHKLEVIRVCYHNDALYLRNPSSGAETLLVRNPGGRALSSDGKWVVYRNAGMVWLVATDGSSRRQIERPSSNRGPSLLEFSDASSALFVFYRESGDGSGGEFWLYPVQGGPGRKLYESRDLRDINYPVFSPDGQLAVIPIQTTESKVKKLFVYSTSGGEPWELPVQQNETPVGFTSDGKLVLHSPERGGSPSLWTRSLGQRQPEGKPELLERVLSTLPGEYTNGKYYYYLNSREGGWERWVMEGLK